MASSPKRRAKKERGEKCSDWDAKREKKLATINEPAEIEALRNEMEDAANKKQLNSLQDKIPVFFEEFQKSYNEIAARRKAGLDLWDMRFLLEHEDIGFAVKYTQIKEDLITALEGVVFSKSLTETSGQRTEFSRDEDGATQTKYEPPNADLALKLLSKLVPQKYGDKVEVQVTDLRSLPQEVIDKINDPNTTDEEITALLAQHKR